MHSITLIVAATDFSATARRAVRRAALMANKLKDGNASKAVQARYTFQYAFENGRWVIEHHHSSAMPEKVTMKH